MEPILLLVQVAAGVAAAAQLLERVVVEQLILEAAVAAKVEKSHVV